MRATSNRHIPPEIIEEILLNLPVQSLLRFSSVSMSWNLMIFKPGFVKRYRRRAALPGRERIALVPYGGAGKGSTCLISSISSKNPTINATEFLCPFGLYALQALCDDMWLALDGESLILWNPSMRMYKKVQSQFYTHRWESKFVLGLGYESVGDDYKILKIPRRYRGEMVELYSLRSDSWRNIQDFPKSKFKVEVCLFVRGKLHWMCYEDGAILCFDLLTEELGKVGLSIDYTTPYSIEEMSVLSGMLCVSIDCILALDIWVMEEYGKAKSWTKKFSILFLNLESRYVMPLYLYENGEVVVRVCERGKDRMFVYKDAKSREELDLSCCNSWIRYGHVYVDSLVSPTSFSRETKYEDESAEIGN